MTGPNDFNQSAVGVKTFSKVPTKIKILFRMWTSFDTQRLRIQSTSPEVSAANTKIDFSKFCHNFCVYFVCHLSPEPLNKCSVITALHILFPDVYCWKREVSQTNQTVAVSEASSDGHGWICAGLVPKTALHSSLESGSVLHGREGCGVHTFRYVKVNKAKRNSFNQTDY